jgi:myo-inositol catabolism protein IolC
MTEKVDFTNFLPEEETKLDISEVKDVSEASNRYLKIESEILSLENDIKIKKSELQQMNDSIVQLMEQRGVKEIKLTSGEAISYKPFYKASITKDKEADCFEWLEKNNHGELIKNIVSVRFGKGDNDQATRLVEDLEQNGLAPDQKRKVEPMTLNAFVGEQINAGADLPLETFSVFTGNKVKIKKGK